MDLLKYLKIFMIFGTTQMPVLNLKINGRLDFNNHKSKYPEETKELERRLSEEMPEELVREVSRIY